MKQSNLTFAEGFTHNPIRSSYKAFDWDKAAEIIKTQFKLHLDLIAEAGLQGDWSYTGGIIFEEKKPTNDDYTFLMSDWAIPTLLLFWDGSEQMEIECFTEPTERFNQDTKWDEQSLTILGIQL